MSFGVTLRNYFGGAYQGIIHLLAAATLFENVKKVHEFANFLQPFVENWRTYTQYYWCRVLCAIVGQITGGEAAMLTASLLVGLLFVVDPAPSAEATKPATKERAAVSSAGSFRRVNLHAISVSIPPWLKVRKPRWLKVRKPGTQGAPSPAEEFWTVYWHAIPIAIIAWLIVFPVFGGTPTPNPFTLAKWIGESFVVFLATFLIGQTVMIMFRGDVPRSIDEAARQIGARATMVLSIVALLWGVNVILVDYGKQIDAFFS